MLNYYPSDVIHVKESAGGKQDGTSWEDAYTDLQDGLDEAVRRIFLKGDTEVQVLVAQGKYRPRRSHGLKGNSRTFNFTLYNGVSIRGGFCGTDAYIQDLERYPSIMTGDFGKYRSYHVLYIAEGRELDMTAYMENMIIEKGCANGMNRSAPESFGGGLYIEKGNSPLLVFCVFRDNEAVSGGGACLIPGKLGIRPRRDCAYADEDMSIFVDEDGKVFSCETRSGMESGVYSDENKAVFQDEDGKLFSDGGGMQDSEMLCLHVDEEYAVFTDEEGKLFTCGGSLRIFEGEFPVFYMCRFENNRAYKTGGGVAIHNAEFDYSSVMMGSIFDGNKADYGGGVAFINCMTWALGHELPDYAWSYPLFILRNNKAVRGGGGVYVRSDKPSTITRLLFTGNTSEEYGGGLVVSGGEVSLRNLVFVSNGAVLGGGLYLIAGKYVARSLMFVKNKAAHAAGALYTVSTKTTVDRCYFRSNNTEGLSYPHQIGGAVVSNKGLLVVTNSLFLDNKSKKGGGLYSISSDLRLTCNTYLYNKADKGPAIYNDAGLLSVRSSILKRPEGSTENEQIWGDMRVSYMTTDPGTFFINFDNVTTMDPEFNIIPGALPYVPEENCDLFFPEGLIDIPRGSREYLNDNLFDFIATPRPAFVLNGYLESKIYSLICLLSDEEDIILEDEEGFLLEDFCPEYGEDD